jgi:hypothetical protein
LTLVYQIDSDCIPLLSIGKDHTVKTLLGFFHFLGKNPSGNFWFICLDMWKPYLKVTKKKTGLVDRSHIARMANKEIDEVPAEEHSRLKENGYELVLKKQDDVC